jgi:integrase
MASLERREGPGGRVRWYLRFRDEAGRQRMRRLPDMGEAKARAVAAEKSAETAATRPRREALGAVRALGRFLAHWEEVRRRSPKTVRFYRQKLRPLFLALSRKGPMRSWTGRAFDRYVEAHPEWSPRTVQMVATAARTFTRWARRQNIACADFATDFEGPRVTPAPREAYTVEEVRRLLHASEGRALELPVALAFWAGLSDGDIRALRHDDVREGWIVRPRSKTRVPMLVPVAAPLQNAILRCAEDDKVASVPASGWARWAALCRAAHVAPSGGLKRLRHTFASLLAASGATHDEIAALLGHAPKSITDRYLHPDRERIRIAVDRLVGHVLGVKGKSPRSFVVRGRYPRHAQGGRNLPRRAPARGDGARGEAR